MTQNNRILLPPHMRQAMNKAQPGQGLRQTSPRYPLNDAVLKDGFGLVEYIENTRIRHGGDTEQLSVALLKVAGAGWNIMIDPSVPEGRAVVTIACHLSRDLQNLNLNADRILRLGALFGPALRIVENSLTADGQEKPPTEKKEDTE